MDLIYMDSTKNDIGVLKDYKFDLAFGKDENNFECVIELSKHCCEAGFYLYFEDSEYGGIIDSIKVDTDSSAVTYIGRTWHGILDSKVLEPDTNEDYLIVAGEANKVIDSLLARANLKALFKASNVASGINISNYKMNRYISAYEGIRKMLKASDAKLQFRFKNGMVELMAVPAVDYSKDEQFDTDQLDFSIKQVFHPLNHVICLGKGDLKEREVIHLYADVEGNISNKQSLFGLEEVTAVYDNSNAESTEKLEEGGKEILLDSWNSSNIKFNFGSNSESYDIGDTVGALERTTNINVKSAISKKIVKIENGNITISYKVGD